MGRLGGDSARGTPAPPPAPLPRDGRGRQGSRRGARRVRGKQRLAGGGGNGQVTAPSTFRNHLTGLLWLLAWGTPGDPVMPPSCHSPTGTTGSPHQTERLGWSLSRSDVSRDKVPRPQRISSSRTISPAPQLTPRLPGDGGDRTCWPPPSPPPARRPPRPNPPLARPRFRARKCQEAGVPSLRTAAT